MNWKKIAINFVAGSLMVVAFSPFNLYYFAFISLGTLFFFCFKGSAKENFWFGLAFGYGLYLFGVSWVYVSLSTYGGMPLWMGAVAVFGFAGLLALFIAVPGYLAARFFDHYRLIALPFIWVIFEWSKSWVLTGFPWLDIGYTQTPSWLMAWAPIGGVYLVSFIVLVMTACLSALLISLKFKRGVSFKPLGLMSLLIVSSLLLSKVHWSEPYGDSIDVGVVQPNTPVDVKWQPSYQPELIAKLVSLSRGLNQPPVNDLNNKELKPVDLIIWPETALPIYMQQTTPEFWRSITPSGSAILTGVMDQPNPDRLSDIYNAAALTCDGGAPQVYRKSHLVPFGEYLPLRFLFNWVLEYLQLPMSDLSSWDGSQTLDCGESLKIGLSICYEDAFAAEYRSSVGDATLLVNISEDAWFGDSFAPHQRVQMAQMRAAELSRPLVRSANSGPSLLIDVRGNVLHSTPQFSVQAERYTVQPHSGDTLFKRLGNWIVYLSFICLGLFFRFGRRKTSNNH